MSTKAKQRGRHHGIGPTRYQMARKWRAVESQADVEAALAERNVYVNTLYRTGLSQTITKALRIRERIWAE